MLLHMVLAGLTLLHSADNCVGLEGPGLYFHIWGLGAGCLLRHLISPPGGFFLYMVFNLTAPLSLG